MLRGCSMNERVHTMLVAGAIACMAQAVVWFFLHIHAALLP